MGNRGTQVRRKAGREVEKVSSRFDAEGEVKSESHEMILCEC